MKKTTLISFLIFIFSLSVYSQVVYVDCNTGKDENLGTKDSPVFSINKAAEIISQTDNDTYTMKINPGIYVLNEHVPVETDKDLSNKRITLEASILPDDSTWTPEKMPVIISKSKKGEFPNDVNSRIIVGFSINSSHVSIRGLKFLGYSYPKNFYFPISRKNFTTTDLVVEQCMFLGDLQSSVIQVAVLAHGDSVNVNHCIFYNANNAVLFFNCNDGKEIKSGNRMTNNIVYGASESAIWTVKPDTDLVFKNNIVTKCNVAWVKNEDNPTRYSITNSILVDNSIYLGNSSLKDEPFAVDEKNVIKEGEITLVKIKNIFKPLPINHLHVAPNTLGYNLEAGLFKYRKP